MPVQRCLKCGYIHASDDCPVTAPSMPQAEPKQTGLRIHSDAAWTIASRYSHVLASETRDLAAAIDELMPRWRPIDTAPVPAWDSSEAQRSYGGVFKCLGQLRTRHSTETPWIVTMEAYYVAAPRSTEQRILRWRDGGGRQCFPKYWMPLPLPAPENSDG